MHLCLELCLLLLRCHNLSKTYTGNSIIFNRISFMSPCDFMPLSLPLKSQNDNYDSLNDDEHFNPFTTIHPLQNNNDLVRSYVVISISVSSVHVSTKR